MFNVCEAGTSIHIHVEELCDTTQCSNHCALPVKNLWVTLRYFPNVSV